MILYDIKWYYMIFIDILFSHNISIFLDSYSNLYIYIIHTHISINANYNIYHFLVYFTRTSRFLNAFSLLWVCRFGNRSFVGKKSVLLKTCGHVYKTVWESQSFSDPKIWRHVPHVASIVHVKWGWQNYDIITYHSSRIEQV